MRSFSDQDAADDDRGTTTSSWQRWKRLGNDHFRRSDFNEALQAYRRSLLDPQLANSNQNLEKSLILSNMVACRLQLGGPAHARAAVQDAQQCVQLNPTWSKAYYRLGSAYSATGESNQACNALQTCLRLDSGFQAARQLLLKELRRDNKTHDRTSGGDRMQSSSSAAPVGVDDYAYDTGESSDTSRRARPPPHNPSYRAPEQPQQRQGNAPTAQQQPRHTVDIGIDDQLPLTERVSLAISRMYAKVMQSYNSQSEATQSLVKIGLVFILLYVAFGGRFGLEYLSRQPQQRERYGRYGSDSYSQRQAQQQESTYSGSRSSRNSYYDPNYSSSSSRQYTTTDDDYTSMYTKKTGGSWWNWGSTSGGSGGNNNNNHSGGLTGGISLSWILGAGMVYYLYRHHGFYAAAMFVANQYRFRGRHQHGGWGGGGMYGRPRRGRGWW